jgi:hypothetical protein
VIFVGIGSFSQIANDLWLFALAFLGLLVGYGTANLLSSLRT